MANRDWQTVETNRLRDMRNRINASLYEGAESWQALWRIRQPYQDRFLAKGLEILSERRC